MVEGPFPLVVNRLKRKIKKAVTGEEKEAGERKKKKKRTKNKNKKNKKRRRC